MELSPGFPFEPAAPFLVAVDSDGCVFDTMSLKHLECFAPAFIEVFSLEAVANAALEVWTYVNLRSPTRGINRFKALIRALQLLSRHPAAMAAGFEAPTLPRLAEWVSGAPVLSHPALAEACRAAPSKELERALVWSRLVNEKVEAQSKELPPFSGVAASIELMRCMADLFVLSQTPLPALLREWEGAGLAGKMRAIVGQDAGSKIACLGAMAGRYPPGQVLMLGDAPGDREAARANGAHFFPIIPGREAESWRLLQDEGYGRFTDGAFAGEFQTLLDCEFASAFPECPPWEQRKDRAEKKDAEGDERVA